MPSRHFDHCSVWVSSESGALQKSCNNFGSSYRLLMLGWGFTFSIQMGSIICNQCWTCIMNLLLNYRRSILSGNFCYKLFWKAAKRRRWKRFMLYSIRAIVNKNIYHWLLQFLWSKTLSEPSFGRYWKKLNGSLLMRGFSIKGDRKDAVCLRLDSQKSSSLRAAIFDMFYLRLSFCFGSGSLFW